MPSKQAITPANASDPGPSNQKLIKQNQSFYAPPELVTQHLHSSRATLDRIPQEKLPVIGAEN